MKLFTLELIRRVSCLKCEHSGSPPMVTSAPAPALCGCVAGTEKKLIYPLLVIVLVLPSTSLARIISVPYYNSDSVRSLSGWVLMNLAPPTTKGSTDFGGKFQLGESWLVSSLSLVASVPPPTRVIQILNNTGWLSHQGYTVFLRQWFIRNLKSLIMVFS